MTEAKHFKWDWQFYRKFFGFKYFRLLVIWFALVPAVLTVFSDFPEHIFIPISLDQTLILHLTLPFRWWLLWVSSLLYVVAWLLYLWLGPSFIRQYHNYATYLSFEHSKRWIVWEWAFFLRDRAKATDVDILAKKNLLVAKDARADQLKLPIFRKPKDGDDLTVYDPVKDVSETWFFLSRSDKLYLLSLGPKTEDVDVKHSELFWELFGAEASSRPKLRFSIRVLLTLAGIAFLLALIETILAVPTYFIEQWF